MAFQSLDDLNDLHMDVLREIGNIGSGNAATSLAEMLTRQVNISVPRIRILDYNEVVTQMGGPENRIIGLLLFLDGDVKGMIMFLLEQEFAHMSLNALLGEGIASFEEIDEMGYSAIKEIANIMASSYVGAISTMTDLFINISVPDMCIDMLGAVMSVPAVHFANISEKIIFIEDTFDSDEMHAPSHILLMPDVESLNKIMEKLGIDL